MRLCPVPRRPRAPIPTSGPGCAAAAALTSAGPLRCCTPLRQPCVARRYVDEANGVVEPVRRCEECHRPRLLLMVSTARADGHARALWRAHAARGPGSADVALQFITAGDIGGGPDVRPVDAPEAYPPYEMNMAAWTTAAEQPFPWYMRCDADAFVDFEVLLAALDEHDAARPTYIGLPGKGRRHERARLGLGQRTGFAAFAMGGTCEVMSQPAASALQANAAACARATQAQLGPLTRDSRHLYHHDVELGRCAAMVLHIPLTSWQSRMRHVQPSALDASRRSAGLRWVHSGHAPPRRAHRRRSPCQLHRHMATTTRAVLHPVKDPLAYIMLARPELGEPLLARLNCSCSHAPLGTHARTSCAAGLSVVGDPSDPCGERWAPPLRPMHAPRLMHAVAPSPPLCELPTAPEAPVAVAAGYAADAAEHAAAVVPTRWLGGVRKVEGDAGPSLAAALRQGLSDGLPFFAV